MGIRRRSTAIQGFQGLMVLFGVCGSLGYEGAIAQINPDASLGSRATSGVTVPGGPGTLINGGALRGDNLFHSFTDFNVRSGERVYFNDPGAITSILTRVTGSPSTIDGVLGITGSRAVNLFFLNPRGITFGPNANTADLRGALVLSTGDRLTFADGQSFGLNTPAPLLTVDIFPGLQLGTAQGDVTVSGPVDVNGRIGVFTRNLTITPGGRLNTTNPVSGVVAIEASEAIKINGQPPLRTGIFSVSTGGSSGNKGEVVAIQARSLEMTNSGEIASDTRGAAEGGNIEITAQSVSLTGGSEILARTFASGKAGNVQIKPLDAAQPSSVTIDGVAPVAVINGQPTGGYSSGIFVSSEGELTPPSVASGDGGLLAIQTDTLNLSNGGVLSARTRRSTGDGGNIVLDTKTLNITGGAQVLAVSYGTGSAGNILVNNAGDITISGFDPTFNTRRQQVRQAYAGIPGAVNAVVDPYNSFSGIQGSIGQNAGGPNAQAGNILISTDSLKITNLGEILASVDENSQGDPGFVSIVARGDVVLDDANIDVRIEKNAVATSRKTTPVSLLSNLSSIASGTLEPGTVFIASDDLRLNNSRISATSFGQGNAGAVYIGAKDEVSLDNGSGIYSRIDKSVSGTFDSGGVLVVSHLLLAQRDSQVNVTNFTNGNAGDVLVISDFVALDRGSLISAASLQGQGGNVVVISPYLTGVSRESDISTTALFPTGGQTGGLIFIGKEIKDAQQFRGNAQALSKISTLFVYGFPLKDSNIKAEGFTGNGGRIYINATALRNLDFSNVGDRLTYNDVTTASVLGRDGITYASNLNIDPDRGLNPLVDRYQDPRLSEGCDPRTRQEVNVYQESGRQTAANNPAENLPLSSIAQTPPSPAPTQANQPIRIAQSWEQLPNGDVKLVSAAPAAALPQMHPVQQCPSP